MKKTIWILCGIGIMALAVSMFLFPLTSAEKPQNGTIVDDGQLPTIKNAEHLTKLLKERTGDQLSTNQQGKTVSMEIASAPKNTSTTNIQEQGVSEGDSVKTNGEYIFFARTNDIVISSAEQKKSSVLTVIKEEGFRPLEIYLSGNKLITIGTIYRKSGSTERQARAQLHIAPDSQTMIYIYDISTIEKPKKLREVVFEGTLHASRLTNNHLYLIANSYPPVHIMGQKQNTKEQRPTYKDSAVSKEYRPIAFNDMYILPDSVGNSFLITASINLKSMEKPAKIAAYLGSSNHFYMSKENMYIAVNKLGETKSTSPKKAEILPVPMGIMDTKIFQFNVNNGAITYHASTEVNGTLINQFAMDEFKNTFRVATTSGNQKTINNIYTFDLDLRALGALEDLAPEEKIYSVRFKDEVAYMVTFKQMDPLFVIDLKDPKEPNVLGKLKIPGFSNYLHPLNENYVVGFGQHTEVVESELTGEPQVRQKGLKISLFDVSDVTHPVEIDHEVLGGAGSYSEINRNHHVLYQHPTKNLFGFPASIFESKAVQQGDAIYQDQQFVYEGAFLYTITPENGIQLKDTITHQTQKASELNWEAQTKRMVSVDNYLYTLSFKSMKVYDLEKESVIKTLGFPEMSNE